MRELGDRLAALPGIDEGRIGKARNWVWIGLGLVAADRADTTSI